MGRSRREGQGGRIRGGEGQLPPQAALRLSSRGAAQMPHFGCSAALGLFAREAGAPGQETNSQVYRRLGPAAAGADTGQTRSGSLNPPSSILPAAVPARPRLCCERLGGGGRPGPPPPPGWWGSERAPGEAWPPGPASRWGPLQGDRHQAEEQSNFFSLPMLRILHPFLNKLTRGGRTPIKIGLVQKAKVREGEREGGGRESRAGEGLRGRERGEEREEGRRMGETQAWFPLVPRTLVDSPSRAGSKPPLSPHP